MLQRLVEQENARRLRENLGDAQYFERGWANADTQGLNGFGLVNALVWPSKPRVFGVTFEHGFGGG